MTVRKLKISVSLDADLVGAVDRLAEREGATRSAIMERWLNQASRRASLARLEEETAAYYDGLSIAERHDDAVWAAAATGGARRLRIDGPALVSTGSPSARSPRRSRG